MENILQVGIISSTHGIRGEVKVFPTTDDVNRFKKLKEVLLEQAMKKLVCRTVLIQHQDRIVEQIGKCQFLLL